jgi:hypothetical protein
VKHSRRKVDRKQPRSGISKLLSADRPKLEVIRNDFQTGSASDPANHTARSRRLRVPPPLVKALCRPPTLPFGVARRIAGRVPGLWPQAIGCRLLRRLNPAQDQVVGQIPPTVIGRRMPDQCTEKRARHCHPHVREEAKKHAAERGPDQSGQDSQSEKRSSRRGDVIHRWPSLRCLSGNEARDVVAETRHVIAKGRQWPDRNLQRWLRSRRSRFRFEVANEFVDGLGAVRRRGRLRTPERRQRCLRHDVNDMRLFGRWGGVHERVSVLTLPSVVAGVRKVVSAKPSAVRKRELNTTSQPRASEPLNTL